MIPYHAPWRTITFWRQNRNPLESLFSQIARSTEDETNYVIARPHVLRAANTVPYTGGHLMIVPYKQTADSNELTEEELSDLMKLTRRCQNALKQVMHPDGFNVGLNIGKVAGAVIVEHLHVHIGPRWQGDTNFMLAGEHHGGAAGVEGVGRAVAAALNS
jgi:ATP adenylyltransferase